MSELRRTIDQSEAFPTDSEQAADTEARLLFLDYVVKDVIRIYFNITSRSPIGDELPPSLTPDLEEWTTEILTEIDKLFNM